MRSKFKWIFTLLVAFTMQFSFAQQKTVTGVVSDDLGPVAGANVVVKGTTTGTTTDFDGNYSISAKQGDVLVISYAGSTQSVTVGAGNSYDVTLKAVQLKDVEVVGALGIKRKADQVTSAYQQVGSKELTQAANPNVVQSLAGKVSGLQINTTNSSVNSDSKVVLRGARSLSGSNEALVVIDGAISSLNVLQQISPDLIENVNVIKGAQGAALYGSDGVNGVIIVTTKKGQKGERFSVGINSSIDFTDVAYLPQTQKRYGQGWDGLHSSFENGSWGPEFDGTMQPVGLIQADGTYFYAPYSATRNGIKDFFQTGKVYQTGINIAAGTLEDGYINFGANRTVNEFIVPGDESKRNSFLLNAGKKLGKFRVEANINYITANSNQANNGTIQGGLYADLLQTPSNVPVTWFNHGNNENHWNVYYKNPYWTLKNKRQLNKQDRFQGNITLGYEINKNINVSYLASIRLFNSNSQTYNNGFVDTYSATYGANAKSELSSYLKTSVYERNYYGDLMVNFNYMLTDDISFAANIGNNLQDKRREDLGAGGNNLDIPGWYNTDNVLTPFLSSQLNNDTTIKRKIGVFGNFDFGYKDYLFLNLTGRNDWSSVFSKSNNSYFYPSAGVSFIPTKAIDGLQGDILRHAKISASIVKVGNDGVGEYDINQLAVLGYGSPFNGANSYVLNRFATDANITPEFVTTKEIGVLLAFFKGDRVTLDASYYVTDTDDLITDITPSAASGLLSTTINAGAIQTKGYEIDLGFTPIKTEDFRWDARVGYTHFKTKVKSLNSGADQVELRNAGSVGIFAEVGEEYPLIKGTSFLRDDFGRVIVDANGLPTIDSNFKTLGKTTPDYILNFNTSVTYKGFSLSTSMDFRTGHSFYSGTKQDLAFTGQLIESAENRSGFIMPNSAYDYDGDGLYTASEANTSVVTAASGTSSYINYTNNFYTAAAENFVLDATALKIRELALSYSLPSDMVKNMGLTSLAFGVNARNFYTWLPKQNRGYNDPETAEATGNLTSGLAFTDRYPSQSSYGFSVNLKF